MIVKREFVRLGKLFETDKEAEAVFLKAAEEAYDDERRDKILSTLLRLSLSEREMGWCLTGIEDAIDCFERLEKEMPYDSELSPHQTVRGGGYDLHGPRHCRNHAPNLRGREASRWS